MISSITLGSTELTSSKRYCTGISNLAFPQISYTVRDKGGFLGRKVTSPLARSYKISTEWTLIGDNFSDLADEREEFAELLGSILSVGSRTLKITKSNSVTVQIDVKTVNVIGNLSAQDKTASFLLVELEAEYPFLMSSDEFIKEINIFSGGGMEVPMAVPMDMSTGGNSLVTVPNEGSYKAYPTITFYGIMENPTLTNETTGDSISLTHNLTASSQYITIDTFLRTVTDESGNNLRGDFSGDFMTLATGDNEMKLSTSSGTTGKCYIHYRYHYLGV